MPDRQLEMRRRPAVLAAALLLAACGRSRPEHTRTTVRDSAGVSIVEITPGRAAGRTWSIDPHPLLDLGGDTGDGRGGLYQVGNATRLSDGRVVVANGGSQEIRVYGTDGRLQRSMGRAGSGPGEFRFLRWVGVLPGDSIAGWDPMFARLSVFTPAGALAREVTPATPLGAAPMAEGLLPGGRLLLAVRVASAATRASKVTRDTVVLAALSADGRRADPVARVPGAEVYEYTSPGFYVGYPLPFGHQTLAATQGRRVFIPAGEGYEVRVYGVPGGLARIIRVAAGPVKVTGADVREYRRTRVSQGIEGNPAMQARVRQILTKLPFPRTMAPITALAADSAGDLWVQEAAPVNAPGGTPWRVFDERGRPLATVRTPRGLRVTQVGGDWVLGVRLDEQQAEHVRIYRLNRR